MKDNVQGIKGEYREPTPKQIGGFVRSCRKVLDTKRQSLADQAGVSEKTLERLEWRAGQRGRLPEGCSRHRPAC